MFLPSFGGRSVTTTLEFFPDVRSFSINLSRTTREYLTPVSSFSAVFIVVSILAAA
jgi:hypothetical protein